MLTTYHLPLTTYLRLMRLHQPVGIWLLFWPCAWAVTLAGYGVPNTRLLALFFAGALVMRGAGCIVNDLADREFDAQVERTKNRPLASGELRVRQALILLAVLLCIGFTITWQLGWLVTLWAALSLILVASYPFMKRLTWWPQLFLGFTFNWGAWMGWVAVRGEVEWATLALYVAGIFWTLGYDTIYAHQDKEDDIKIGVKSTALRLGGSTKPAVAVFYTLMLAGLVTAGFLSAASPTFYALLLPVAAHLAWQLLSVNLDSRTSCGRVFKSNAWLGGMVMLACAAGRA